MAERNWLELELSLNNCLRLFKETYQFKVIFNIHQRKINFKMVIINIVVLNSLCAISTEMEEKKEKKRLKDLECPKRCGNLACERGK